MARIPNLLTPAPTGELIVDMTQDPEGAVSDLLYTLVRLSGKNREDAAGTADIRGVTLTYYLNGRRNVLAHRLIKVANGLGYDLVFTAVPRTGDTRVRTGAEHDREVVARLMQIVEEQSEVGHVPVALLRAALGLPAADAPAGP